jgi:hypothetical protein
VTLLEAPEPPSRLVSNSLSPDSVARLVSATTVEATLAVEIEPEVLALVLAPVLAEVAAAWLLLILPIDIMTSIAAAGIRVSAGIRET